MPNEIVISELVAPMPGEMGGSIHSFERSKDPFHQDAMPDDFKDVGAKGKRKGGWMALDAWGNAIGFVADGETL